MKVTSAQRIVGDVEDDEIDLLTGRAVVDPGPQRSRRCWDSFVQHYHPDLAGLLAEISHNHCQTPAP